jgi:hypothetical protein
MGLDQLAGEVDADQPAVATDRDLFADVPGGDGVQGAPETDVMIGMDFDVVPARRVEALTDEGLEGGPLDGFEDFQRSFPDRAVDPLAGLAETPANRLALRMVTSEEGLAAKEALPDVGNLVRLKIGS